MDQFEFEFRHSHGPGHMGLVLVEFKSKHRSIIFFTLTHPLSHTSIEKITHIMREYRLRTVIPTTSDARGLYYDGDLYFSSHNHLFKCSDGGYSKISDVGGTIIDFRIGERLFMVTEDRMYMSNENTVIGSLKRNFSCIDTNEKYIAVGCKNVLEIWNIPTEFKFTLFNRESKNFGHFLDIISVRFIDDDHVITTSRDCTVRIFDIQNGTSRRICSTIGIPLAAYVMNQEVVVVCDDGVICYYTLEDEKVIPRGRVYPGSKILSSSCHQDFICISLDREDEENLIVYKGSEKVYGAHVNHKIIDISLFGSRVAVRGCGFVGIYDLILNLLVFELDLPRISSMDVGKEIVAVGCHDKKVRVYDERRCIHVFQDSNITHPIFNVHVLKNSVLCVTIDGGVSIWDMRNGICYRSFKIGMRVSASEASSDNFLLFLADFNEYVIRVIDLQRSKEIDVLRGHDGPIFRMRRDNNSLYSLSYDNSIRKWNVYSQTVDVLRIERLMTGLSIRNHKLCVATDGELMIYDSHLNYDSGIKVSLKARKRNEVFISEKPVEHLDLSFDNEFIVVGGESNTIKIISMDTGDMVQSLRVSHNKEWENYKERLGKESTKPFDKTKMIEVMKIIHSDHHRTFYVLTREGVSVYEPLSTKFTPINLDVSLTPESIHEYLRNEEYLRATIGSLRINQYEIIKNVVLSCSVDRIEGVVKHLDEYLVENLRLTISRMLDNSMYHLTAIKWLKSIVFYFGSSRTQRSELYKLRKNIGSTLKVGRLNRSILLNIIKK